MPQHIRNFPAERYGRRSRSLMQLAIGFVSAFGLSWFGGLDDDMPNFVAGRWWYVVSALAALLASVALRKRGLRI